ncbi:MAG: FAD-binding protein [Nitriliruptorales bacterium]|nr:FAD-binding protein [Nitriliruptorales bacterium]
MSNPTIEELRSAARGAVIGPDDGGYEGARAVYNAMIDRRPRVIVRPADVADVMATVTFARSAGLELAVRGGAHSVPGFGTVDDGVVLDLSSLKGIRVDPVTKTVRAQAGCTWGDLDHATHAFGLATTGGILSTTGIAGLSLGGGIGYLGRRYGLTCDNLLSADVVTADGRMVTASAKDHEDLFWALRGGGGNFGVVTEFEYRLHPVKHVYGGPILYDLGRAADVLRWYREYIAAAPEEQGAFFAFLVAPPLPFIPEERHGTNVCGIVTCWSGPLEEGERQTRPFLEDVAPPIGHHTGPMPYPALQSAFDGLHPPGMQNYWKADFVHELTDDAVQAHVEHGANVPHVHSTMHLYPLNGAPQRVAPDETAFAYRDANIAAVIVGMWPDAADNDRNIRWVRDYWEAIHPHDAEGGYINFMSGDDQDRIHANYRGNYDRLTAVKAAYDPDNLFHLNQNIQPSST